MSSKMLKFLSVMLALAMLAGLAACGGAAPAEQPQPEEAAPAEEEMPAEEEAAPAEEMAAKIRAAVKIRKDPDLMIIARTDAISAEGFDEAVRRGNLYRDAGADVVYAPGLASAQDIEHVVNEVGVPVNVLAMPTTPPIAELGAI